MKKYLMIMMAGLFFALPVKAADSLKGMMAYLFGDYETALAELMPLAQAGDAEAQFRLGVMYDKGQGVLEDDTKAAKWFRLAAEQGLAIAQAALGGMYAIGQGILQDFTTAHVWLSIAATNGFNRAAEWRDLVAEGMTASEVRKAQALARKCLDSNYEICP